MGFGELLLQIRKERGIQQKNLAGLAGISTTLLSNIELGKKIPSESTASRLIEVLGLDEHARTLLMESLKEELDPDKTQSGRGFIFGIVFGSLIVHKGLNIKELAGELSRSVFTVRSWCNGSMLPSDITLENEIATVLKSRGITDIELQDLKIAHIQDILTRSLKLAYLRNDKVQHLRDCLSQCVDKNKTQIFT